MKIVFFGSPPLSTPILTKLEEKFDVVEKITKPIDFNNIKIKQLKALNPDFFVVASYGKILPVNLLYIPKITTINIHPSLLPIYRGPTPIQTAILNDDKKTGITFMEMDSKMDHGPIIEQFEEEIFDTDTFETLGNRLFEKSANMLEDIINNFKKEKVTPQDHSKATFTKMLTRQSGNINLSEDIQLDWFNRLTRAFYPWPGVWTKTNVDKHSKKIIKFLPNKKVQVEGKNEMSYKDFLNGYPNADKSLRLFLEKNL